MLVYKVVIWVFFWIILWTEKVALTKKSQSILKGYFMKREGSFKFPITIWDIW